MNLEINSAEKISDNNLKLILASSILCSYLLRTTSEKASQKEWAAITSICEYLEKSFKQ